MQFHSYFPHCSTTHALLIENRCFVNVFCWFWSRVATFFSPFLGTGMFKWSIRDFWLFSTERFDFASPQSVAETLKAGSVWRALVAQLTFGNELSDRGTRTAEKWPCPRFFSIHSLSLGSAWEKWALDRAKPPVFIQRDVWQGLTCLPVWVCVQTCWSSVCFISNVRVCQWEQHILMQTSDMWPVLLPSHWSSANSHASVNQHPNLFCLHCLLQYL